MSVTIGDIEAGRDVKIDIKQIAQQPEVKELLDDLEKAEPEAKAGIVQQLLDKVPELIVPIVTAAVPHLLR